MKSYRLVEAESLLEAEELLLFDGIFCFLFLLPPPGLEFLAGRLFVLVVPEISIIN